MGRCVKQREGGKSPPLRGPEKEPLAYCFQPSTHHRGIPSITGGRLEVGMNTHQNLCRTWFPLKDFGIYVLYMFRKVDQHRAEPPSAEEPRKRET